MSWTKEKIKGIAGDLFFDVLGSILFAVGIYTFASNAAFAPGGVSGLALIVNHLSGLPIGIMTLVINVPIILVSYRIMGKKFLIKSLKTMLISTFFMDAVIPLFPVYSGSKLLAAVFTGVFSGLGLVLIYMRGSSTGGADFLILSIKKLLPHLSIGDITLVMDSCVILFGGIVFGNIDAVLYGMIATFSSTVMIDKVMYGAGSGNLALIITDDGNATAKEISDATGRGATLVNAVGTFSGEKKHLILCACSRNEVLRVRKAAHEVDKGSLIMVAEVSEVFGEGFKNHQDV